MYDGSDWDFEYDDENNENIGLIVEGSAKSQTILAVLWITRKGEEVWIPKSQILNQEPNFICITDWLAEQRGWTEAINIGPKDRPITGYANERFDIDDEIPF